MQTFERTAKLAIGRAVFFAGLAISMVMLGMAFDFALALRGGAVLSITLTAVLVWYAQTIQWRKLEHSETWLLLGENHRPCNEAARAVLTNVMRETYLHFAVRALAFSLAMFAGHLALRIAEIEIGLG